jgi:uncharacterized protein (DUF1330 family)
MTVYLIAEIKVTNDAWLPGYAITVHDIVHRHGGKYLSRSGNVKTLEGKPSGSDLIALIEFPSEQAVRAFADDPQYRPFAEARQRGSHSRLELIERTDAAGTIEYLPKS